MLSKLQKLIRQYEMLAAGDTVTCAVSGGADSMALLWAMYLLAPKLNIRLQAAHFNHRLRQAESDRDEAFVRAFCSRCDIPLFVGSGDVVAGKKGLEAAARDARYQFLRALPGKIATAHTADDNAETVLMHLVRGTGLKGLGAIAPVSDRLIRPMLTVTRQEVLAFLEEQHIDYVEDSSNASDAFLRNRLRRHVMPLLRQENPRLSENLSAMALRLREDEKTLSALTEETASVPLLREMSPARRSREMTAFLKYCGVREPEAQHIAQIEELVFSDRPSARASFPGGITVSRQYDMLSVCRETSALERRELTCPGCVELPELGLRVLCKPARESLNQLERFTVVPRGRVYLRTRLPGDTMRLSGGTKTLQRLFIDKKIPQQQRMQIPVLADDAGVLGVYGLGANRDRLSSGSLGIEIRFESVDPSGML